MALTTLVIAGLVSAAGPGLAGPVVRVKGRPSIALDPVHRTDHGIEVRGRVTELAGGDALPFIVVTVRLGGQAVNLTADGDGLFVAELAAPTAAERLEVEIMPDPQLSGARIALDRFDVEKRTPVLEARADPIDGGDGLRLLCAARDDRGEPVSLALEVAAGPVDGPVTPVGELTTDDDGGGQLEIGLARLGGAGSKRIELAFAGDDLYNPARFELVAGARAAAALDLQLDRATIKHEGQLAGGGQLTDATGRALASQPVSLLGKGRVLAELVTDGDGRYRFAIDADELGAGALTVQAVFEPGGGFLEPAKSAVVTATIAAKRPVPVGLMLLAFATTAGALASFVVLRTRPWQRWLARLRRAPAGAARPTEADAPPRAGLSLARPGLVNTLRRAHDFGLAGAVRSATTGRAIVGAVVEIEVAAAGPPPRRATSGADGGFALEDLPAGRHQARVVAAGHVTESFAVDLPHRGELRGARIDLMPVREHIFALYRVVAEPLLPRAGLWGVWTPRQIFDAVRERRPAPALAVLTDFVEQAYFSWRVLDESELGAAADHLAAARSESRPTTP